MSDSKDKDRAAEPVDAPPADARPVKRSGRVAFDSRNNPIWEWQLETGVYSRDVTTQKLKKLDLGDLSIAESAIQRQPPGLNEAAATLGKPGTPLQLPGGGFNPYDNSTRPSAAADPYNTARALGNKVNAEVNAGHVAPKVSRPPLARPPLAPAPAPKPSALGKIGQWFKGKRKADDDYE